jgi:hypothetical protein
VSSIALTNALLILQGSRIRLTVPSSKFDVFLQASLLLVRAHNSENRKRRASKPRKTNDNAMRKMQVPAYGPTPAGVQASEYSGVVVDVKNTIIMSDIPIRPDMLEEDELVAEGIVILPMSIVVEDVAFAVLLSLLSCWKNHSR